MKQLIRTLALVVISALSVSAQSGTKSQDSPKTIVDNFLTRAINGELQTPEGWQQADVFFAHPSSMPYGKPTIVIGEDYSTHEIWVAGNHAEVIVTYRELGRIDPSLRYSPPVESSKKIVARYDLILASKGTSGAGGTKEVAGTRQWRIQNPQRFVWTGSAAAVRYVTEICDKATDPVIKRNINTTLMALKKLQ